MVQTCPGCGEENPDRFRLCGYCGSVLVALAPSHEVRKTVTVVFCNLKGSTELAWLDSEALREVLSLYFSAMKPVLERHGGTIEKYIGDVIMAVFGLPRMHEDDALRAVRAAAQMRKALAELNVTLRAGFGVTLETRTGVSTGEVVTGVGGGGRHRRRGERRRGPRAGRAAGGDPDRRVHLPAGPGRRRGRASGAEGQAGACDGLPVGRGHRRRQQRQVGGPTAGRPGPRARRPARGVPPFGRRTQGRLITLVGEAGIGKSRLVEEFVRSLAGQAAMLQGRCLSYGDGITFWPLAEVFRQAAGIVPEDSEEDARAKLASHLGATGHAASRIELVLGLSRHRYGLRAVLGRAGGPSGAGPASAAGGGLRRRHLGLSPPSSISLRTSSTPRWGCRSSWSARPAASSARTAQVSPRAAGGGPDRAGGTLPGGRAWGPAIRNLLGEAGLPKPLEQRIVGLKKGNPLFVEQVLSMLIDDGLLGEQAGRWVFWRPPRPF